MTIDNSGIYADSDFLKKSELIKEIQSQRSSIDDARKMASFESLVPHPSFKFKGKVKLALSDCKTVKFLKVT